MSPQTTDLDPAVGRGLANLLLVAGDNKYYLGRHLSQWAVGAPGLETAVAAAAIAQGHLGQSRALLPIANDLAGEGHTFEAPDERDRRYAVAALDQPFDTWPQAVATLYLVDPALDVVLRSLGDIQEELQRRVNRVLEEARFHFDFARGRLRDLVEQWPNSRGELEQTLQRVLPETMCWFGPQGEEGVEALHAAGVLSRDNEEMRQRYLDVVMPTLQDLEFEVGVTGSEGEWSYGELPWENWNRLQRRLTTT